MTDPLQKELSITGARSWCPALLKKGGLGEPKTVTRPPWQGGGSLRVATVSTEAHGLPPTSIQTQMTEGGKTDK